VTRLDGSLLATIGSGAIGRADGDYAAAEFNMPQGMALDRDNNLYVADTGNNAVKEILAVNGGIPASPTIITLGSGFNSPSGVAVDRAGNVFVADSGNSAAKEILAVNGSIPSAPTILTLETNAPATFVAIDGSGNIYFSGAYGPVAELLAVNGSVPASPTVKLIGPTSSHSGVAVDASGNVYVADGQSTVSEILAVNGSIPSTPTIMTLSNALHYPAGLSADSRGNIYIADSGNSRIAMLDFADAPNLTFAPTAVGSTSVDSPQLVAITNAGNAPLSFPIPLAGTNPSVGANFTIGNGSTCPMLSPSSYQAGILPPGTGCMMPVRFTPTTLGALSSSLVFTDNNLNAAAPNFTSSTSAFSPSASFLERMEATMSGIEGTVAVASRKAYSPLSAGTIRAVWPQMTQPTVCTISVMRSVGGRLWKPGMESSLSSVPPVMPRPRPEEALRGSAISSNADNQSLLDCSSTAPANSRGVRRKLSTSLRTVIWAPHSGQ